MRIVVRRRQQLVARQRLEETDERLRAVKLGDERRLLVDRVAAHAAALLVARQIVAVDLRHERARAVRDAAGEILRQEFVQIEERVLARELAAQPRAVEHGHARGDGGVSRTVRRRCFEVHHHFEGWISVELGAPAPAPRRTMRQ
ncbi:hypothetical protein BMMON2_06930 [Burkholderia mallei]